MPGYSIIVKRGALESHERYDLLHKAFGQRVAVTWDRRRGERRQTIDPPDPDDRREGQRRGPPDRKLAGPQVRRHRPMTIAAHHSNP